MSDHVDGPRSIGDPSIDLTRSVRVHQPGKSWPHGACCKCLSFGGSERDVFERGQSLDRGSPDDRGWAWRKLQSLNRAIRSIASIVEFSALGARR